MKGLGSLCLHIWVSHRFFLSFSYDSIHKYASCSNECFILALIYIDRLIQRSNFLLTELNVHRVVITSVLLAAKFFDDAYYNNAYYAKVGGVLVSEMNGLEVDFLFRINFSLHVAPDVFDKYRVELVMHSASIPAMLSPVLESQPASPAMYGASQQDVYVPSPTQPVMTQQHHHQQQVVDAMMCASQITPSPPRDMIDPYAVAVAQATVDAFMPMQRANSLPPVSNPLYFSSSSSSQPRCAPPPTAGFVQDPYELVKNQLYADALVHHHHHHGTFQQSASDSAAYNAVVGARMLGMSGAGI